MGQKMKRRPTINKISIAIDCADATALAEFCRDLLGWELTPPKPAGGAITSPASAVVAFQEVKGYVPPVWPWESGQMLHLDLWLIIWRKLLSSRPIAAPKKPLSNILRHPEL